MHRQPLLGMILAFAPAVALAGPALPSFPLDSTPPLFGARAIVTPEPGTALLLGGAILALAFGARRRPA